MAISMGDIFVYFRGNDNDVEQVMRGVEDKANSWAQRVGQTLQGALSFMAGDMLIRGVDSIAGAFQSSAIDMNASLETTTMQFTTLMRDADRAKEHVAMLFELGKETPFETEPIIQASLKLQTFGGAALNTRENILRVGNAAAAVNAPIENLGFWVGRMYSSIQNGKPFGEAAAELQNMGVVGSDVTSKMQDMQAAGASADEIWAVFTAHLDTFSGAMEDQAGTWEGLTSTLNDTIAMLGADVFRPFFDLAKDGLNQLVAGFASPVFEGFKQQAIAAMQGAATWIREVATNALPALIRGWQNVQPAVQAAGTVLSTVADLARTWGNNLVTAFTKLDQVQEPIASFIGLVDRMAVPAFTNLWSSFQSGQGMLDRLAPTFQRMMTALAPAIQTLLGILMTLANFIAGTLITILAGMLPGAFMAAEGAITSVMNVVTLISNAFTGMVTLVTQLINGQWGPAWQTAKNIAATLAGDMMTLIGNLGQTILGIVMTLAGGVIGLFQGLVTGLVGGGGIVNNMVAQMSTHVENLKTFWANGTQFIKDSVLRIFNEIVAPLIEITSRIVIGLVETLGKLNQEWATIMQQVWELVQTAIGRIAADAPGWASSAGSALIGGLWEGMQAKWGEVEGWLRDKLQSFRDMLPSSEPKDPRSPLRGLKKSGSAIVGMIQMGMGEVGPLEIPRVEMPSLSLAAAGSRDVIFNGPLIGNATIKNDDDISKLAYQVAKEIRMRVRE